MADCVLLGDSIAVGLSVALRAGGLICAMSARVGASSAELFDQIDRAGRYNNVILSAGTNDHADIPLKANLIAVRRSLGRAHIIWLLPYKRRTAYTVARIAFRYGDDLIDLASFPTRDRIHPASYQAIATKLLR